MPDIAAVFGGAYLRPDGSLDRDRMRALAFADASARHRLEALVHPLVQQETERRARDAITAGARCVVFDIPLLVESGRWAARLDRVLVVDCSPATQVARVVARSQLSPAQVQQIIGAQASRADRLRAADAVLFNDGIALEQLQAEVGRMAPRFGL